MRPWTAAVPAWGGIGIQGDASLGLRRPPSGALSPLRGGLCVLVSLREKSIGRGSSREGRATDAELWEYARRHRLVLVTKDADISDRILRVSPLNDRHPLSVASVPP